MKTQKAGNPIAKAQRFGIPKIFAFFSSGSAFAKTMNINI